MCENNLEEKSMECYRMMNELQIMRDESIAENNEVMKDDKFTK